VKYCKFILWTAALLISTTAMIFGQGGAGNHCVVHLDKSFYVNGEVMWYKLYLPETFRGQQPAIKVKLIDKEGDAHFETFLRPGGGRFTHGYYKIPFDFPTGMYHLVFLASENQAERPVLLAESAVPVYNDESRELAAEMTQAPPQATEATESSFSEELQVDISLSGDKISSRDPVSVSVTVRDASGRPLQANLSVAVTDWELVNLGVNPRPTVKTGETIPQKTATRLDTALYAKVKITDEAGTPLQANVLGVFSPKDHQWTYTTSNTAGFSFVELQSFSGVKSIQFLGYEKETESIRAELLGDRLPLFENPLVFNKNIEKYLDLSRRRKKIFQHRSALEFELNPPQTPEPHTPPKPDLVIEVKDYESFDNLATFFREVPKPLRFRLDKDSTYYAEVANPQALSRNFYYSGKPLFIIDGKITRNADFVGRMPTDQIQEIGLFFRRASMREHFNVFGNSGVVVITTSIPDVEIPEDEAEDILPVTGLQAEAPFPVFHPDQLDNNPHLAFFRPQLYWNPVVETDENGQASFSFYQSDDRSTFRIEVVAQSEDGRMGRGVLEYEVK